MSSPHLLTHSLPQHEAPPGQHDLLQEHSTHPAQVLHHDLLRESQAHRAHLQTFTRSERIATGPLWQKSRVSEPCEQPTPQVMSPNLLRPTSLSPTSLRPRSSWRRREVLWKTSDNYTMYRENWENEINKLQLWKRRVDLDTSSHKSCSIKRWEKCHPLRRCPTSSSTMRRVHGKHCGLWSRRWKVTNVADFITLCPRSFWETKCNCHSGKRGKCTNVSFIRRSGCYRETGCTVFTKTQRTEKPNVEFCVRKRYCVECECSKAIKISCWIEQERI